MDVKPGYKQTEVGVIPEDWHTKTCLEVSDLITVGIVVRPTQYYARQGVPALRSANVREGRIDDRDMVFISEKANALLSKSQVRSGDVLTVRTGYPGTSAVVPSRFARANCIDILITRPSKLINPRYLSTWINSPHGKSQILRDQGGLAQQHFNVGELRNLVIALPPTRLEQDAIAEALSDADALIESLEQLIAKKRRVKLGAMQELLTGKRRLPGCESMLGYKQTELRTIPEDWDVATLRAVSSMKSGEGITSADIDEFSDHPCYGGNGLRGFTTRFTHEGSYALIGRQGALCGNILGVEGRFFASEHAIVVTASARTDIRWLTFVLGQMRLNQYSESSAQPGLSVSKLLDLSVSRPRSKAEQAAIAAVLSDMDAEIDALEQKLVKARQVKQGMMQELLSGGTRLV
jgi:type I restriction enzyme, S subunit